MHAPAPPPPPCLHAFCMAAHASGPVADNKEAASSGTPADERVKEAGEGAGLRQEFSRWCFICRREIASEME